MYHICPAYGQAHLFDAEMCDRLWLAAMLAANGSEFPVELGPTALRGVGAVDENRSLSSLDKHVDLGKSGRYQPRLVGQRQGLQSPLFKLSANPLGQVFGHRDRPFEASGEDFGLDCGGNHRFVAGQPHAPSRQLTGKIWDDFAGGGGNEPDEVFGRVLLAGQGTQTL